MSLEDQVSALALSPPVLVEQDPPSLLSLPDELLETIFELAYGNAVPVDDDNGWELWDYDYRHALKPVCRRLWPFQQRVRYWYIDIASYGRLTKLEDVLARKHQLANLIVHLSVSVREPEPAYGDEDNLWTAGAEDDTDDARIVAGALERLFDKLGQLESLTVRLESTVERPSTRLARALLAVVVEDPRTPIKLHGLKSLDLRTYGKALDDDAMTDNDNFGEWMRQLSRFGALEQLGVQLWSWQSSFALVPSSPHSVLNSLTKLSILANFDDWDLSPVALAPNLVSLDVWAFGTKLSPIISFASSRLVSLHLKSPAEPSRQEHIDDLLPSFPLLQSLTLNGACFRSDSLPSTLRQLDNLTSLEISKLARITDELLRRLVDGPTRLVHLQRLSLNHVGSRLGPSLLRRRLELPGPISRDESGAWRGSSPPDWPQGCSEAGTQDVVARARAWGVVVTGFAVKAADYRRAYAAERDVVAVCRGVSTGDWTDARRYLENGDERVDAFLARRRREGRRRSLGFELSLF